MPPSVRSDLRVEHDAREERRPRRLAALRPEHLPDPSRRQLAARIAKRADPNDRHVELVADDLDHPPDGPLRHAALPDGLRGARRHLGAVRERDRERVEVGEMAKPKIHSERLQRRPRSL